MSQTSKVIRDHFSSTEEFDIWLHTIPAYNYAYISNAGQVRVKPMKKALRIYLCMAFGYMKPGGTN